MNNRNRNLSHVVPDDDDPVHALLALRSQTKGSTLDVSSHNSNSGPMKRTSQRDRRGESHQTDVVLDDFLEHRRHDGDPGVPRVDSQTTRDVHQVNQQHQNQCVAFIGHPMPLPPRLPNPRIGSCDKVVSYSASLRNDST
jgi:hypothetical protein